MDNNDQDMHEKDEIAVSYGKFDSAEDLLSAYNALQSEFTKRCQLLKQLQAELNVLRAQTNDVDPGGDGESDPDGAAVAENVGVKNEPEPEMHATENGVSEEILRNVESYAEVLCEIPEIMDACIARYKKKLLERDGYRYIGGAAVIAPAKRPRTLSEAKALADKILK